MCRCKTLLSAASIIVLIGGSVPTPVEAKVAVEVQVRSQTAAPNGVAGTADQDGQSDVLGRRVTLNLVDTALDSALEAIARLAGFTLAYNPNILPAGRTVTLNATDLPARDALARVLEGTGLEPTLTRTGQLTLVRQPDPPARISDAAAAAAQQAVVTGTVTDEATGEALRGVQVRVDESEQSTVTDAEGRYTLEDVLPGTHTLLARTIGYREGRHEVTVTAGTTVSVDCALAVSAVPLDEVVVTGTMVPTRVRAVPSPVSVITAEDIERKGIVRFEDILRSIPGVGVVGRSGQDYLTYIYVRGAASLDVQRSTIKTYIDGIEVANARYSLNQIDPTSIDRIELIRGPQASTIHGSEAVAGVLQIFTKRGRPGTGRPHVQATLAGGVLESRYKDGSALVQNHTVAVTGGERSLSYRLSGSYSHTSEWVEDDLLSELGWDVPNSAANERGVSGSVQYSVGPVTADLSGRAYKKSLGAPIDRALTDAAREGGWNYPHLMKPSGTEQQIDLETYGLTLSYPADQRWQHRLTIGRDETAMEIRQPQPRITTPADTFLAYQYLDWQRTSFAYNTAIDVPVARNLLSTIQTGVDFSTFAQRIISTRDAKQLEGGLGNEHADLTRGTLTNHGFFVQAQTAWRDQLFLTAGLRADRSTSFNKDFGYAWSPRVGIAQIFNIAGASAKWRASYGRAIRPPEPQHRLGQTLGSTVYLANTNIKPEAQSGYDIGFEVHVGSHSSISVTRYEQWAEDLVALVRMSEPSAVPQVQQYQNVGRIKNLGWEVETSLRLERLTVGGHYGFVDSTVDQLAPTYTGTDFALGQRPLNTPTRTGGLNATLSLPRVTVTVGMTYKGTWHAYRYLPYFEAIFGTDPNREPYRGSLRDYIDVYPAVYRYEVNAVYEIASKLKGLVMIDNLLNDNTPDQWDYHLVRGRQLMVGIRFDSGL